MVKRVENSIIAITFDYPELSSHLDPSAIRDRKAIILLLLTIVNVFLWAIYLQRFEANGFSHSSFFFPLSWSLFLLFSRFLYALLLVEPLFSQWNAFFFLSCSLHTRASVISSSCLSQCSVKQLNDVFANNRMTKNPPEKNTATFFAAAAALLKV